MITLGLFACGGDSDPGGPDPDPDPTPEPSEIVIVNGQTVSAAPPVAISLELQNDGGPGVYVVDIYSLPTVDEPDRIFYGRTEPIEVDEDYAETVGYEVEATVPIGRAEVFSRDQGSAVYRQTDQWDFPPP